MITKLGGGCLDKKRVCSPWVLYKLFSHLEVGGTEKGVCHEGLDSSKQGSNEAQMKWHRLCLVYVLIDLIRVLNWKLFHSEFGDLRNTLN